VETALLGALCADQLVLVVRPGWAQRRQVRSAVAVLAQQGAPVTLSVLARVLRRRPDRTVDPEAPTAADTEPVLEDADADPEAGLDAELAGELDGELDKELDEDSRVLSGGGPARGGDS
jgi:hypothetical protein